MSDKAANIWGICLLVIILFQVMVLVAVIRRVLQQGQDIENLKVLANEAADRRMKRVLASQSPVGSHRSASSAHSPLNDLNGTQLNMRQNASPGFGGGPMPKQRGASPAAFSPQQRSGSATMGRTPQELAALAAQRHNTNRNFNPLPAQGHAQYHQEEPRFSAPTEDLSVPSHDVQQQSVSFQDRMNSYVMPAGGASPAAGVRPSPRQHHGHVEEHVHAGRAVVDFEPEERGDDIHLQSDAALGSLNGFSAATNSVADIRQKYKVAHNNEENEFHLSPKAEGNANSLLRTNIPPLQHHHQVTPVVDLSGFQPASSATSTTVPVASALMNESKVSNATSRRSTTAHTKPAAVVPSRANMQGAPNPTMACILLTPPEWVDPVTVAPLSMVAHLVEADHEAEGGSVKLTQIPDVHAAATPSRGNVGSITASLPVNKLANLVVYPAGPEPRLPEDTTTWYPLRLDSAPEEGGLYATDDVDSNASSPDRSADKKKDSVLIYFMAEQDRSAWSKWLQVSNMIPSLPCDVEYPSSSAAPIPPMRNASKEATMLSPETQKHGMLALGFSPAQGGTGRRSGSRPPSEPPLPPSRPPLTDKFHNITFDPHAKVVRESMSPPRFNKGIHNNTNTAHQNMMKEPQVLQHQYAAEIHSFGEKAMHPQQPEVMTSPPIMSAAQKAHEDMMMMNPTDYSDFVGEEDDDRSPVGAPTVQQSGGAQVIDFVASSGRPYGTVAPSGFDGMAQNPRVATNPSAFPTTLNGFDEVDEEDAREQFENWDGRVSLPAE